MKKHIEAVHAKVNPLGEKCLDSRENGLMRKNWKCNLCNSNYYSYKYLENHMKRKHNIQNETTLFSEDKIIRKICIRKIFLKF